MVQTVDFFTPIVNDPYLFGQIAAANSISDIYAMGARPVTAMNLAGFPSRKLDISVLKDILRGGSDKMAEAGVNVHLGALITLCVGGGIHWRAFGFGGGAEDVGSLVWGDGPFFFIEPPLLFRNRGDRG